MRHRVPASISYTNTFFLEDLSQYNVNKLSTKAFSLHPRQPSCLCECAMCVSSSEKLMGIDSTWVINSGCDEGFCD